LEAGAGAATYLQPDTTSYIYIIMYIKKKRLQPGRVQS
jgi:hypothetical protein